MKNFKKTAAFVMGSAMMISAPAGAQINSVNDLLQKVRNDAAQQQQVNAQREAEFKARRDQQASLLRQARAELATLERQARNVQSTFDGNERRVSALKSQLKSEQGEFGEVFGLARSQAGQFKATLENSLINAQYPNRTKVLGVIAESEALPSTDQLNAIWHTMLTEMKAQRKVDTFEAPIANLNEGAPASVTRVGPFSIFTTDSAEFLEYKPTDKEGELPLTFLRKQPGGAVSSAASAVAGAGADSLVFGPVDPTRGSLLKSLERVKSAEERVGNPFKFKGGDGGIIGLIIWWLLIGVALVGIIKIVLLAKASAAVKAQKKRAQPSKSNPLGRVMMAYDGVKDRDEEIIELKLDEAILRESPKLEWGLTLLKLGAGIAPLLGLLGTVTGMIKTFQAMMIYGAGDPQLMAGGISEALVTTMLGLIAVVVRLRLGRGGV